MNERILLLVFFNSNYVWINYQIKRPLKIIIPLSLGYFFDTSDVVIKTARVHCKINLYVHVKY